MSPTKEIAFAFPRYDHYEKFIDGVLHYASEHDCQWSYLTPAESASFSVLHMGGWPGDGLLAEICTQEEEEFARKLNKPIVNISSIMPKSDVPLVCVDNDGFGVLAADHLLSKGFPCFGFYGVSDVEYSIQRREGFSNRLSEKGHQCAVLEVASTYGLEATGWYTQHRKLAEWIQTLNTPCGLFAISDYRARQVLDACRQLDIEVPKTIGIIGADNLTVICEHSTPSLTSIDRNNSLQGYRAAELLDAQIRGERISSNPLLIPPLGIVERGTTAYLVSDPRIVEVKNYLQDNLKENIGVKTICSKIGVSRRWLESEFRKVFGESPYQYIRRQRLSLARKLLVEEPDEKVSAIALRTGFSSGKQLYATFVKEFGQSPREYRRTVSPYRSPDAAE